MSPLLFLLVAKGLSRALRGARAEGHFTGIQLAPNLNITHLLFVDDVLIFCSGTRGESRVLQEILDLFSKATGMEINIGKSTLTTHLLRPEEVAELLRFFPYNTAGLEEGIKYLGFSLKANMYRKQDWLWLVGKVEQCLMVWSHKWLSRAGRLVLVKAVLEAIPVFWMSLSWIPKGILERIRKVCFRFLWSGKKVEQTTPWISWKRIAVPKCFGGWGLKDIFLFSKALATKGGWRMVKTDSLWTRVIKQKYLFGESITDWIRNPRKSHLGGSVIWKAIVKSFHLIETNLAWDVGNGESLLIGRDPWMGSNLQHRLPNDVIDALGQRGITSLNHLAVPRLDEQWRQSWRRATSLGLGERETGIMEHYLRELDRANILLTEQEDTLVWEADPEGIYTPKTGYLCLSAGMEQREDVWWWKPLWRLRCPAKSKLFMWSVLNYKVPTWDVMQRRSFQGPGWCVLCKREMESSDHLFLTCSYSITVWREVSTLTGFHCQWEGATVGAAWESWWRRTPQKQRKILPLLVIWGIWIARNKAIFQDIISIQEITGVMSVGYYKAYPEHIRVARERRILEVDIDRTSPWAFFDGAAQNNVCGGGVVLFFAESHFFVISMGLGGGTNNFAELMSLKLLLIFALEKGCNDLNILGDSMNVINWIN